MIARKLVLCLMATPLAILPAADAAGLPALDIETYTLDNGLEVILHQDHSTPIVSVNIWYHVGSKNERPGRSGFAHLFEHMMFQGSEHQDGEFFGPLQEVGARLNGSTSEDRTNYWEVVPSNHLERALLMEADRMGWLLPAMTQEKLDNQKDVVRNERRQSEGQPYSVFWLETNRILYPKGHPYDHSVIGEHEDLEAASLEDVKDFFRQYYTPNNATLCLAGDFDKEETKQWIAQYFGEIPPGPPVQEVRLSVPEITREQRVRFEDRVQLPRVYFVWHTAPYFQPGDAEMDLAANVLGQGRTSRLYKRLVHETEMAQDVSVFQSSQQIASQFVIQVTLKPGITVQEIQTAVDEELAAFRADGPTREEMDRVKSATEANFIKRMQRVGSWGGKSDRMNLYNHYLGTPDYFAQDLARYMDATPDQVRKAAETWLHQGRVVFEVHPMGGYAEAQPSGVNRADLPEGGPQPELIIPALERATLDNGLETMAMTQGELPLVQLQMIFRTGASTDLAGKAGLADLTTDMLLDGTERMDKFTLTDELKRLGTDVSTNTTDDYAVVSMVTLKKNLDESVGLLADMLTRATFPEDELERQKARRVVNIQREKENPWQTVSKVARKIVYGDHPYSQSRSGTEESMASLTRDDLATRAREHFTPQNAVLIAVGDITSAELAEVAKNKLGDWQGPAPVVPEFAAAPDRTERAVYFVDKPGDSQSTISIVHLGVRRNDPEWERIFVANRVLGGMFSSRLNLNIREDKGYSYGTRSGFSGMKDRGAFSMGGRVQTEVTAPALVEFMKELEGIHGENPLSTEEVEFAKNSVVRGYAAEFETNGEIAGGLVEQAVFGLPDGYLAEYPKMISAVSADDANAAGREFFHPGRVAVVVIGDVGKIEESVRDLNLGPIYYLDADGNPIDRTQTGTPE